MTFEFDAIDEAIKTERFAEHEQIEQPRLGDYVLFPTGELERFSCNLGDGIQTSPDGAFYLSGNGGVSFGGSLNPPTPRDKLDLTDQSLPGSFWFFHHGSVGAGRRVNFQIPCRVYSTTAQYQGYLGKDFQCKEIEALKRQLQNRTC